MPGITAESMSSETIFTRPDLGATAPHVFSKSFQQGSVHLLHHEGFYVLWMLPHDNGARVRDEFLLPPIRMDVQYLP